MKVGTYRDGGTRSFRDSSFDFYFKKVDVEICQDNRIGSTTKGQWFLGYPDKGALLTEKEKTFAVQEIIAYLGREYKLAKYIYEDVKNTNLDCTFKDDFQNVFSLKMASSSGGLELHHYVSEDYSIMDENGLCTLKLDENILLIGSLEECFNCCIAHKVKRVEELMNFGEK